MASSFQVVRVGNGDTIQVRSGVLQGIGPQGNPGATGPRGPQGDQGPRGETGAMGRLEDFISVASVANTSVATGTDVLLNFTSILDEMNVIKSSTTLGFDTQIGPDLPGAFWLTGWVRWSQPGDGATGWRKLWITLTGESQPIYEVCFPAAFDTNTTLPLNTAFRVPLSTDEVNIYVRHNDNESLAVEAGRLQITRAGSGPKGDQGAQGVEGPEGPVGPAGPQGLAGSAGGGYTTIDELGGV